MNRAWIPAGALAGVSVAGLIALGALTDSLGTPVPFQTSVTVATQPGTSRSSVPVSYSKNNAGSTKTAALRARGGAASAITPDVNSTTGLTGYRRVTQTKVSNTPSSPPPAKSIPVTKQSPKRAPIGTLGGTNSTAGLTGDGSSGPRGSGEQSGTPGSDGQ